MKLTEYVKKKTGLILGITTDFFFEVSIQNLISKLLTFIPKKWGTACLDILLGSKIMGKNVKKNKIQKKPIFVKILSNELGPYYQDVWQFEGKNSQSGCFWTEKSSLTLEYVIQIIWTSILVRKLK